MIMYKQIFNVYENKITAVLRLSNGASIPFDPANSDYQQFKTDVLGGAELQDADGNIMSKEEATAFIGTLP